MAQNPDQEKRPPSSYADKTPTYKQAITAGWEYFPNTQRIYDPKHPLIYPQFKTRLDHLRFIHLALNLSYRPEEQAKRQLIYEAIKQKSEPSDYTILNSLKHATTRTPTTPELIEQVKRHAVFPAWLTGEDFT